MERLEMCLCGHTRDDHAGIAGHMGCFLCTADIDDIRRNPRFTCKPGRCDRFTYNAQAKS